MSKAGEPCESQVVTPRKGTYTVKSVVSQCFVVKASLLRPSKLLCSESVAFESMVILGTTLEITQDYLRQLKQSDHNVLYSEVIT